VSARIGRVLLQEIASTIVWLSLLSALHKVHIPKATAILLALAAGAVFGALVALLGWWMGRPMTIAPMWELTGRVAAWLLLTTTVALVAVLASPAAAMGLFAAVVAGCGAPTARQIRTVIRERQPRRHRHRVCHCPDCRRPAALPRPRQPNRSSDSYSPVRP
jgi:hypothetical protein